jgi:acyl carrier protein
MEIPQEVRDYIDSHRSPLPPLTDPDEPVQLDSLALIRLVAFLESDFGIRVEDEELILENFETLRRLGALLESKSPAAEAPELPKPDSSTVLPGWGGLRRDTR